VVGPLIVEWPPVSCRVTARGQRAAAFLERNDAVSYRCAVVVELEIRFGLERDHEGEGEVSIRRLRETEVGVPVVKLSLKLHDVRRELVVLQVVRRVPVRGPFRREAEPEVAHDRRRCWNVLLRTTRRG